MNYNICNLINLFIFIMIINIINWLVSCLTSQLSWLIPILRGSLHVLKDIHTGNAGQDKLQVTEKKDKLIT